MMRFFAELRRRQMFRVGAAYAVVTWLLLQIVNNVAPVLDLPPWVARAFLLLLVIGFPISLLFVWMHELAPGGDGPAQVRTNKLDWVLAGGLAAVIALILYQQLAPSPGAGTAQKASVATSAPAPQSGAISIAVLPLANLSGDATQEFFSDGMTEEITSALAKVQGLTVLGRTSAFQFKGQNRDLRDIGQALGATHLIEGSVRKAGTRIRITAQLIRADSGAHLWTENYDRELTDIFAVQEDIAQAIAGALRVPLGLGQGQALVSSRTANLESYQDYLRAKALVRARGPREPGGPLAEATTLLEQVVARDPNYVPAWALLAQAYALTPVFSPPNLNDAADELRRIAAATVPRAESAAQQAIRRDPGDADGYAALAMVQHFRGRLVEAEDLFKQALSLDPGNPDALNVYGMMLSAVGRLKDSLLLRQRLRALEPFVPAFNWLTALVLWVNGQNDDAIAMLRDLPASLNTQYLSSIAQTYASVGRYAEAADALLEIPSGYYLPGAVEEAVRLLRTAPGQRASPQPGQRLGLLGFVYLYSGAPDRVIEWYEGNVEAGYVASVAPMLWHSSYAQVRKTERFKALMRNAGIVAYWRVRGWPDLCRPVGADDFVCD